MTTTTTTTPPITDHHPNYTTLLSWRARLSPDTLASLLPPVGAPFASNLAYRQCLRGLFGMDPDVRTSFGDGQAQLDPSVTMDAETADELAFDVQRAEAGLRDWFTLTEDDPNFLELYDLVGYTFLQTDPTVGASALMNFDDFASYCRAMAVFVHSLDMNPLTGAARPRTKPKCAPELPALIYKFRREKGADE